MEFKRLKFLVNKDITRRIYIYVIHKNVNKNSVHLFVNSFRLLFSIAYMGRNYKFIVY